MTTATRTVPSDARSAGRAVAPGPDPPGDPLLLRLSNPGSWLIWVVANAALGLLLSGSAIFSTLHMLAVLAAVVLVGCISRRPAPILAVTLYAGVGDVLWRATDARGPWESGKLCIVFGASCLALRFVPRPRDRAVVITMIGLLVPGAVITALALGPLEAREYISSNLAGLVALGVAVLCCANLRVTAAELRGLYAVVLGPIVALTASATLGTLRTTNLNWTDEVNSATSAGFGPNQVSSVIGLGALLCALTAIQPRISIRLRVLAAVTGVWMVGQMVLTFSRGGVFGLILALAAVGMVALLSSGQRTRTIVAAGVLIVVGIQIMSWAGAFTGGAAEERFSSTDTTNRWDIAAADMELFYAHPYLGVGAGMGTFKRQYAATAAHTEYSRLLAEHGVLGIGVLVCVGVLCVRIFRAGSGWYRMASVGFLVTALSQMAHSATRIGSIAVAFALAALQEA